jgi:anti-sigma factor RsiW
MKCTTVRSKLAGYLDDVVESSSRSSERGEMRVHLDSCAYCREELQRYRKLAVLLSRAQRVLPPSDLAVRIKVAAAQAQHTQDWRSQWQRFRDRAEILLDNVFRPITLPATGGVISAMLVFVFVLQLMAPGITVQAIPNDVQLNIMQPAELITLSDSPGSWAPESHDTELALPHGLLLDVTVDQHGQMIGYQILAGPKTREMEKQLDQMLLFSRFHPMTSFGRPTSGGHVILSFSAVRVRG